MNAWLVAAAFVLVALLADGVYTARGPLADRLIGFELGGILATIALLLLAEGYDRDIYFDLAVVVAAISFTGSLVFARFLERWL
jgi:multicomponent Na+:H+ antiporter subunit F